MDGKNIVTVHPDALHTVADGTGYYAITSIVLTAGGGDSIAVVATIGEREKMKMNILKCINKQYLYTPCIPTRLGRLRSTTQYYVISSRKRDCFMNIEILAWIVYAEYNGASFKEKY